MVARPSPSALPRDCPASRPSPVPGHRSISGWRGLALLGYSDDRSTRWPTPARPPWPLRDAAGPQTRSLPGHGHERLPAAPERDVSRPEDMGEAGPATTVRTLLPRAPAPAAARPPR